VDIPDETLFEENAEKELYTNIKNLSLKSADILKDNNYSSYLSELVKIKPSLDSFFENVMVMVKDEKVKNNSLSLFFLRKQLIYPKFNNNHFPPRRW
jgi:glycyl-tRNA synthetase beta chain